MPSTPTGTKPPTGWSRYCAPKQVLQGESSVACLAELAGAALAAVSQHLAKLRLAGLVKGRPEGTFVYYSAADDHVKGLLDQALFHADHLDRDLPEAASSSATQQA
ncbi:MAG TPA: metalloregulator ArsR/SmtB family transcription factor [Kribbella sp.]|uniref:ArsR/SmtB family transcription factor n=1 Tax=Kribbella sp. TaxID=1871183 RepID=UPI002D76CBD0|nr:metalloregulator ArsR/SmtB family transcription factor [Kribbella sp.]HET6294460.1 metalloregulator ArsR/SmtB family transcription factor [Kribbella sp.]